MSKKIKKAFSVLFPILLGIFLIYYTYTSFTDEQLEKMKSYILMAKYEYILISMVLALGTYIIRAYRWRYTIEHLGHHSSFLVNFYAVCIGYFVNMSVPRSGEISRALVLKNYRDVPLDKAIGTIIAERIIDSLFLFAFIAAALFFQYDTLESFLLKHIPLKKLIILLLVTFILAITAVLIFLYSKVKLILWIKEKLKGFTEGIVSVFKMKNRWLFLFYTILIWALYFLMFYITIFALDATSSISFGVVTTAFVVGSLAIVFSNSGFGVYPFLIASILSLYQIPFEAGNAFGWIVWTSQIVLVIFLGGISFLLLPLTNKRR